jgi:sigma-B regulation protein RsbU (phosphoserine phosphatase)
MHNNLEGMLREQLVHRRHQLDKAIVRAAGQPRLHALLDEVDAALERMEHGHFGLCETCGDPIEPDRLLADPLVRLCLDHLTPLQATALERDLDLARRVQQGLLPASPYEAGGWRMAYHYRPAGVVSGDYCDVVTGRGDEWFFLLGDVAGKGVAASMQMTQLHGMFRALIPGGLPLSQLVERASTLFCESTLPMHYATLLAARACADGRVELCNAGHVPPLLVQRGAVTRLESGSLPVGMFCSADYPVTTLSLNAGDALVFVTDGVTEAENADGLDYGLDRLGTAAASHARRPAEHVVEALLGDVDSYRAGPMADDATVMVVCRT